MEQLEVVNKQIILR